MGLADEHENLLKDRAAANFRVGDFLGDSAFSLSQECQRIEQQLGSYASRSFFFGAFSYNGEFAARYAAGGPFLFRFAYLRSSCIPVRVRPAVL